METWFWPNRNALRSPRRKAAPIWMRTSSCAGHQRPSGTRHWRRTPFSGTLQILFPLGGFPSGSPLKPINPASFEHSPGQPLRQLHFSEGFSMQEKPLTMTCHSNDIFLNSIDSFSGCTTHRSSQWNAGCLPLFIVSSKELHKQR